MPLYIPWLTETIKKRGVRYLLHHYLGQFFLEKLTLEQLSIDIYEGKGSITNLALDYEGLNDELDFVPFKFLEGCLIGQISVEVPWSSLSTDACRVELEGAKFMCRLKTSKDANKTHCTESTLLSRSLMTSSMQMAEDIIATEANEDGESPMSCNYGKPSQNEQDEERRKAASQMFEGLEMFAQLIDSVLRRTKLTARNTLFQIQPHQEVSDDDGPGASINVDDEDENDVKRNINANVYDEGINHHGTSDSDDEFFDRNPSTSNISSNNKSPSSDKLSRGTPRSDEGESDYQSPPEGTVEFFIKFFRCEEIMNQRDNIDQSSESDSGRTNFNSHSFGCTTSGIVTKLLTLEDVEMRIGGTPVSNLVGKHTIEIKFDGKRSEISIFSSSPLLAVIDHEQLKIFFKVFDSNRNQASFSPAGDKNQKVTSPDDYTTKQSEKQPIDNASSRNFFLNDIESINSNYITSQSGRRWTDGGSMYSTVKQHNRNEQSNYDYDSPSSSCAPISMTNKVDEDETSLNNIEAFSLELNLPGIWLCIIRDGETIPPLLKPFSESVNSFKRVTRYINDNIQVPHLRLLALKVRLDITPNGIKAFLGDLNISEHLNDDAMNPSLQLFQSDLVDLSDDTFKYEAQILGNKNVSVNLLSRTRVLFDPRIIDRIVCDYKLIKLDPFQSTNSNQLHMKQREHDLNLTVTGKELCVELQCPIPDLTPEASMKPTHLRPQSFLFNFDDFNVLWQLDKLTVSASELVAFVKTQPQQSDREAVKFIESSSAGNEKILLTLEPSPSNLDTEFPNEIERTLNESSMFDSIYVGQSVESQVPKEAFQIKRKVVGLTPSATDDYMTKKDEKKTNGHCKNEKIVTPADRQHLLNYLNQTVMSTKLSLSLHLPVCEVEFEGKEQLDLIYNRFANDFVFWQPKTLSKKKTGPKHSRKESAREKSKSFCDTIKFSKYNQPIREETSEDDSSDCGLPRNNSYFHNKNQGRDSENSFHSMVSEEDSDSEYFENEATCKIIVGELFVKFNHQSCAAALRQEISANNVLLGIVVDINKRPNTILSLVADQVELSTDSDVVLEGNAFGDRNSIFSLTAEIKRPAKSIKDIKLSIQLVNGMFKDFKTETFKRFWQSINVTDEPILGYVAPKISIELHVDILNTTLSMVRDGARPALLVLDELYLTSMVIEETKQVQMKLIADDISLYLKRNRKSPESMKSYVCLIDSGLIDLDVKLSSDGRLEFEIINNMITVRVCQDSLSALFKLFNVLMRSGGNQLGADSSESTDKFEQQVSDCVNKMQEACSLDSTNHPRQQQQDDRTLSSGVDEQNSASKGGLNTCSKEKNLLEDAMSDYFKRPETGQTKQGEDSEGERPATSSPPASQLCSSFSSTHSGRSADKHGYARRRNGSYGSDVSSDDICSSTDSDEKNEAETDEWTCDRQRLSEDSDGPLEIQSSVEGPDEKPRQRNPNACLLDESNPLLGNLFSQPLQPECSATLGDGAKFAPRGARNQPEVARSGVSDIPRPLETPTTEGDGLEIRYPSRRIDESGFFVIGDDDIGAGIIQKEQSEPVVRKLIDGNIKVIDNHFQMSRPRTIPEMLASSRGRYVLEEMTLVVNIFGGHDFDDPDTEEETESQPTTANSDEFAQETSGFESLADMSNSMRGKSGSAISSSASPGSRYHSKVNLGSNNSGSRKHSSSDSSSNSLKRKSVGARRKHLSEGSRDLFTGSGSNNQRASGHIEPKVHFGEGAVNLWESLDLMSSPEFVNSLANRRSSCQPAMSADSKLAGGTWRENDVCIQLILSKIKLLYEICDDSSPISWRFMLFIKDIEVKDRVHASDINKMLYEYCNESTMPRRDTQFLTIRNVATINPSDGCEECDLRVSLKPLRLNIDQDTLLFLIDFFTAFSKSLASYQSKQQGIYGGSAQATSSSVKQGSPSGAAYLGRNTAASSRSKLDSSHEQTSARRSTAFSSSDGSKQAGSSRSVDSERSLPQKRSQTKGMRGQLLAGSGNGSGSGNSSHRTKPAGAKAKSGPQEIRANHTSGVSDPAACTLSSSSSVASLDSMGDDPSSWFLSQEETASAGVATSSSKSSLSRAQVKERSGDPRLSPRRKCNPKPSRQREQQQQQQQQQQQYQERITAPTGGDSLPTHCHTDGAPIGGRAGAGQPIYVKSFTFSPDVPIRLDYHAKHLDFEQGALAGILMGLAHLDHSELVLRRVHAKHGMRGLDRVLSFTLNSWKQDIKQHQLPSILSGIGPMHNVIQLFQGMRDLVWMPIDHYRKDRPLVRGLQRGASSFSSSTAMATINLMNRFISIVQYTAQIAHDIVTPPSHPMGGRLARHPSDSMSAEDDCLMACRHHHHHHHHRHSSRASHSSGGNMTATGSGHSAASLSCNHRYSSNSATSIVTLNQPRNFCEGVAVGYTILKEGINDAARNVAVGMQADDVRGAVGGVVRQIPNALLSPLISVTSGAQNVLVGIRNQIAPDARREDQEKWKGRVRTK